MLPSRRLVHPAADDDFVSYISGSNVPSPKNEKKKKQKKNSLKKCLIFQEMELSSVKLKKLKAYILGGTSKPPKLKVMNKFF